MISFERDSIYKIYIKGFLVNLNNVPFGYIYKKHAIYYNIPDVHSTRTLRISKITNPSI